MILRILLLRVHTAVMMFFDIVEVARIGYLLAFLLV